MPKIKNASSIYEIAEFDPAFDSTTGWDAYTKPFMRLARGITDVNDKTDETVDKVAYFDGDGTEESEVSAVKLGYDFKGEYIDDDTAMNYIRGIETKIGDDRKVVFRVTRVKGNVDGTTTSTMTYTQKATVSSIVTTGGKASEYETFECNISFDKLPQIKTLTTP